MTNGMAQCIYRNVVNNGIGSLCKDKKMAAKLFEEAYATLSESQRYSLLIRDYLWWTKEHGEIGRLPQYFYTQYKNAREAEKKNDS